MTLPPVAVVTSSKDSKMDNSTTTQIANSADTVLDLVSDDVRQVFEIINYVILCGIISFFGIGANIINMSVFVRQGFKDSINISLLGLAVSDLVCSTTMFWLSSFFNPLIHNIGLPIDPIGFISVAGAWPHICFSRVTSFITAFITMERCLCIAIPLKVKNIITPFRTKVIIISIFASVIALFIPIFFMYKLEWKYSHSRNRSILGLTFAENREIVESVTYFIHSVFLLTALLICVIICTIILVVKLNKKTKWRAAAVAQTTSKAVTASVIEKKVVKMIILISTIFIACNFPTTVLMIAMVFFPEFSVVGRFENTLYVLWSVFFVLDTINSSVNILVYFNMSTKYRITLNNCVCAYSKIGVNPAVVQQI